MTAAELRALADKKEQEDKVFKKGKLKFDLWTYRDDYEVPRYDYLTKDQVDKYIKNFSRKFTCVAKAGTEFVCYMIDGEEVWYDAAGYGIEQMHSKWAKEHLNEI